MLKRLTFAICYMILSMSCSHQAVSAQAEHSSDSLSDTSRVASFSLEDVFYYGRFASTRVGGVQSMKEGKYFTAIVEEHQKIGKFDVTTGRLVDIVFDAKPLDISFDSYAFNQDESYLLLAINQEKIYRHSTKSNYAIYHLASQSLQYINNDFSKKQSFPLFSPDGTKVAFVQENNLYYKELSSEKIVQITSDGEWNKMIHGMSDWVYEEEFMLTRAYEWSPDSKQIAYFSFDESHVPEFTMFYYGELYPEQYRFKYPKAGEENSKVTAHMYKVDTAQSIPVTVSNEDMYFPRMKWTSSNELVLFRMNRHQNKLDLLTVHPDGNTTLLFEEKNPYYISEDVLDEMEFLQDGSFLWTSEKFGHKHIYHYNQSGELIRQVTNGDWEVISLYGYDGKNKQLFYQSTEGSPLERRVYKVNIDGTGKELLTIDKGWNNATFTPDFSYFIHEYSNVNQPPVYTVKNKKGVTVRVLEDNESLKEDITSLQLPSVEFVTFTANDGLALNGYMIKPPHFSENEQYPVLQFVYGGPGSQTVTNQWTPRNYFWHAYLAELGYIVVSVDNRGTGARGQEFKKITYQQLGKYEVEDQIATAKQLAQLPYVDKSRIGIWGWSYGGYMSSLALFKGNDVFKTAIAVAPVTNWRYYDTVYTERYMRTPQENASGYDANSPISHVEKLKGNFLLIHGMADDNVHFQNTVDMITALNNANKQYDLAIYPNKDHGIYGGITRLQLYQKMTNFILENL